jgi:hypothetical protein
MAVLCRGYYSQASITSEPLKRDLETDAPPFEVYRCIPLLENLESLYCHVPTSSDFTLS